MWIAPVANAPVRPRRNSARSAERGWPRRMPRLQPDYFFAGAADAAVAGGVLELRRYFERITFWKSGWVRPNSVNLSKVAFTAALSCSTNCIDWAAGPLREMRSMDARRAWTPRNAVSVKLAMSKQPNNRFIW